MSGAFSGFSPAAIRYLEELAQNNNKPWFDAHRSTFDAELVRPAIAFVEGLRPALLAMDPDLKVEAKLGGSIFRFNRDLRFSTDKRPYKEELSFRFVDSRGGDAASGFFLRIRPDLVGVGAGLWAFPPEKLSAWRAAVAEERRGSALAKMLEGLELNGCRYSTDALKRVPAPWAADHPRGDLLRLKGLTVGMDEARPPELHGASFMDWCLARWRRLLPMHLWLKGALG